MHPNASTKSSKTVMYVRTYGFMCQIWKRRIAWKWQPPFQPESAPHTKKDKKSEFKLEA